MADDPKVTEPSGGPTPAFDPKVIKQMVADEVARQVSVDDDPMLEHRSTVQPRATENPLEAVLSPVIDPKIRQVAIAANSAQDAAIFYATHPEAVKYKDDIENAFGSMVQQGAPMTHDAIWKWYKGANEDKFYKERQDAEQAKVNAAKDAEGQGAGVRPTSGSIKDAFSATDDELKKGLENVPF